MTVGYRCQDVALIEAEYLIEAPRSLQILEINEGYAPCQIVSGQHGLRLNFNLNQHRWTE